jgi:hypothetical protein
MTTIDDLINDLDLKDQYRHPWGYWSNEAFASLLMEFLCNRTGYEVQQALVKFLQAKAKQAEDSGKLPLPQ